MPAANPSKLRREHYVFSLVGKFDLEMTLASHERAVLAEAQEKLAEFRRLAVADHDKVKDLFRDLDDQVRKCFESYGNVPGLIIPDSTLAYHVVANTLNIPHDMRDWYENVVVAWLPGCKAIKRAKAGGYVLR